MEFMKKDFVKENKKPFNSNKISMTKLKKKIIAAILGNIVVFSRYYKGFNKVPQVIWKIQVFQNMVRRALTY